VWPQGIPWPGTKAEVPSTLDWNLWLGTAPQKDYVEKLVPSTGVAGGIMVQAHWEIWDVIWLNPLSAS
jgi:hypothetical protein